MYSNRKYLFKIVIIFHSITALLYFTFTEGADTFGHDCIYNEWIYIFMVSSVIFFPLSFSTIHIVALPIKGLVSLNIF